jgi:hypothetical protein
MGNMLKARLHWFVKGVPRLCISGFIVFYSSNPGYDTVSILLTARKYAACSPAAAPSELGRGCGSSMIKRRREVNPGSQAFPNTIFCARPRDPAGSSGMRDEVIPDGRLSGMRRGYLGCRGSCECRSTGASPRGCFLERVRSRKQNAPQNRALKTLPASRVRGRALDMRFPFVCADHRAHEAFPPH